MKRNIILIDEEKCNGCGLCLPGCPEGALQMIDGKARLVSDLFCDGLGACLGECPRGAISVTEREAEAYSEEKVMENIIKAGTNTIKAHLQHLAAHDQEEYLQQAVAILLKKGLPIPRYAESSCPSGGCPSTQTQVMEPKPEGQTLSESCPDSQLRSWPVQLHLVNPQASFLEQADLLITADCVPVAFGDFQVKFLKGRVPLVFCPKLDSGLESYLEKLTVIFKERNIRSVTLVRMEVPCCGGMEILVQKALEKAQKFMLVKVYIINIKGEII